MSVHMYAYIFKITQQILMRFFLINRVIQENGLYYVYTIYIL
jgi:hypothetical protein